MVNSNTAAYTPFLRYQFAVIVDVNAGDTPGTLALVWLARIVVDVKVVM